MPAVEATQSFLDAVIRSRIMDRETLMRFYAGAGDRATSSDEQFAKFLEAGGHLTGFQSGKLRAGQWQGLVIGPYTLLYPIGRGGMGIVYLARRAGVAAGGSTPGLLALKLLAPKRARAEPRTLARFRREMEIGAALPSHPALTRAYGSGETDGVHFLALEYVAGATVKHTVLANGPMAVPEAARLFADLALGLHAAHQLGYIHRDLKPANIIVTPNGRAKLLDFGFAVRRGEKPLADPAILGGQGYTLGTMDYLPPEQATDAVSVSAETDIYSLGCSLYFALGGTAPFPYGTAREKIQQHRSTAAPPVDELNALVPAGLAKLVQWMMAKRPEDRPPSCEVVASELERWTEPAPIVATRAKFDAEWEAGVLKQVETRWLSKRANTLESASTEELALPDDSSPTPIAVAPPPAAASRLWIWLLLALASGVSFVAGMLAVIAYFLLRR